ncbi:AAA family ATPase [Deinococcus antarcticus]|uniref:AAA family ATPase n=1 Tax=Deinococcus antarcticus TaxID=1298767 RepID=A0ABV8A7J8_9DEIO
MQEETFEQALEIGQVGLAKLTQGLFWLNPFAFMPLNGVTVPYLDELGVSGTGEVKTLNDYQSVLEQASDLAEDFPALSHAAWIAAQDRGVITPLDQPAPEVNFKAPPGIPLNQILYGPPGTGKTYSVIDEALKILEPSFYSANQEPEQRSVRKERYDELVEKGKVTFVTFHQSFGYDDFIEGLKPVMKGDTLAYERQDGLFLRAVRAAGGAIGEESEQTPQAHVLIIDEINRGNVAKVFGELITLLEDGKRLGRAEGLTVELPLSKRKFGVPESLYVIGTMNTADRSLTQLDVALRRRFTFKKVWPDPTLLPSDLKIGDETLDLQAFLRTINQRIEQRLSRDQVIGHAYLLGLPPTLEAVSNALENKILPLLEEYFFEDWNSIREVLGDDKKPDKADQFILVTGDASADRKSYEYNDEAFKRLSAFQQVYSKL